MKTYEGDEKDDEEPHAAHGRAEHGNKSHENLRQCITNHNVIRNHRCGNGKKKMFARS